MTSLALDPHSARRPHRAGTGDLLAEFADAAVLDAADVHVARTLGRLGQEASPTVALAAALAVRAVRLGSVVVDLATVADTVSVDEVGGEPDAPAADLSALPWPDPSEWLGELRGSMLVADGDDGPADRPLRVVGSAVVLDRYWRHERHVAADLVARAARVPDDVDRQLLAAGLDRLFPPETGDVHDGPDLQRLAAAAAVLRTSTVIAGGPGTGKTTTVARLLVLLHEQAAATGRQFRAALAAPTGKAAARLHEAVQDQASALLDAGTINPELAAAIAGTEASTLHRLLGWNPGNRSRFRHDRANQLPHQAVIVDETSMVSLSLMARLLEAVRPASRLVLVGDPGQLASVEAGAVLGDIVGPAADRMRMRPTARDELSTASGITIDVDDDARPVSVGDGIVVLRRIRRFGGAIRELATAIEHGNGDAALDVLGSGAPGIRWWPVDVAVQATDRSAGTSAVPTTADPTTAGPTTAGTAVEAVTGEVAAQAAVVMERAAGGDARGALEAMRGVQLLCAHRRGPHGVATWRRAVERRLADTVPGFGWPTFSGSSWFAGRPLLVTENDRALQLFNGDTGVVVDVDGTPRCAFERRGEIITVSPSRLAAVETLYAMTIHKSQGSQFGHVLVVLPDETSPILTRELLYTAVTRAQEAVTIIGTDAAVRAAIARPVNRASGLEARLWE